MTPSASPDDVNRRFDELVSHEFPQDRPTAMGRRRERRRRPAPAEDEVVTPFDRWDAADDEEWERGDNRYRPEPPPHLGQWSSATKLGSGMMVLSVLLTLLIAFGVPFPAWVNTVAMVAFVLGLAVLLWRLVTNAHAGLNQRDPFDDGARK